MDGRENRFLKVTHVLTSTGLGDENTPTQNVDVKVVGAWGGAIRENTVNGFTRTGERTNNKTVEKTICKEA